MSRPFNSDLVIDERISTKTLKAYHVGFDQKKFRFIPLVDVIRNVIPEFALGYYCGKNIPLEQIVERLKQAAETVYMTDKYQKRGEFGELILHLLLRDFHNTIPLVSKIYFKDAHNVNVHGFDGVQVTINGNEKKLWLGESKLYSKGSDGIYDLAKDVEKHVNADYLRNEFSLISRKIPKNVPEIDYWLSLMDKNQKLDTVFSSIVIPMVCTYSSPIFSLYDCDCDEYFQHFENECKELDAAFRKHVGATNIEILLLLLPVPNKDDLNKELDNRLKTMQRI